MSKIRVSVETAAGVIVGHHEFERVQRVGDVQAWLFGSDPAKYSSPASVLLFAADQDVQLDSAVPLQSLLPTTATTPTTNPRLTLIVLASLVRWSKSRSNPTLVFSDDDRGITRPGSQSSYPCGRSERELQGPGDGFGVWIKNLEIVANGLTIGIKSHGSDFRNASSNGVGACRDTMGVHIVNVKANSTKPPQKCIRVCGGNLTGPELPLFKTGDRLKFVVREAEPSAKTNKTSLVLDFYLNGKVFHTAHIPNYFRLPCEPLCTLPDNCTLILEQ